MNNTVDEYKKLRKFFIDSEMPLIKTSRGLQKGISHLSLEFKIVDLFDWLYAEMNKNSRLAQIVKQEISLMVFGDQSDRFKLYENDKQLQEAYKSSAQVALHKLNSRNVPIILSDTKKCIESLWYLPPFEGEKSTSYRLVHRSFDIKSAGYSDLLVVAWLIREDAKLNQIMPEVTQGTLYWNAFNVTVYVNSDGIKPIEGTARK